MMRVLRLIHSSTQNKFDNETFAVKSQLVLEKFC